MPEPEADELAAVWLTAAEEDLGAARATLGQREAFVPRQACFSAQQAGEKAVKALAIAAQIDFPFVHDLVRLVTVLPATSRPSFRTPIWTGSRSGRWRGATRATSRRSGPTPSGRSRSQPPLLPPRVPGCRPRDAAQTQAHRASVRARARCCCSAARPKGADRRSPHRHRRRCCSYPAVAGVQR